MSLKKRYVALLVAAGIAVGWLSLGGTAAVMHYTSSTEFCLSCHSMKIPYEEYQGSVHFSNSRGIRAECADCHIPSNPIDYLVTKVRATKDIYHEFVTGKIDNEDKYEEHRMAMAETVWAQFRANDSATCRSCHSLDAMDTYQQSEEAANMHAYGVKYNQTCIDCHKGVAHFAPEPEMDSEAFDKLMVQTEAIDAAAKVVYPVETIPMGELGSINPTVALQVLSTDGNQRQVKINGFQMKGAEQVMYIGEGQRAIIATLTKQGQASVEHTEFKADVYGNEWRTASLVAEIDSPVVASQEPIWAYAEELDNVYCATCHAKIPANHFTINAWGPVAKGMGDRTDISSNDLEILTKFFQNHAKDVAGH